MWVNKYRGIIKNSAHIWAPKRPYRTRVQNGMSFGMWVFYGMESRIGRTRIELLQLWLQWEIFKKIQMPTPNFLIAKWSSEWKTINGNKKTNFNSRNSEIKHKTKAKKSKEKNKCPHGSDKKQKQIILLIL